MEDKECEFIRKLSEKFFQCLRCGECCRVYGVGGVPGYNKKGEWIGDLNKKEYKPEISLCKHLEPPELVNNKWQLAVCKIYDNSEYPKECKDYHSGPGPCFRGINFWDYVKSQNPSSQVLDEVPKAIKEFQKKIKPYL